MTRQALLLAVLITLLLPAIGLTSAHYTPVASAGFQYDETVTVGNASGPTYAGYSDLSTINGSVRVLDVLPNGTDQTSYFNDDRYTNSSGANEAWHAGGQFLFSPQSFLYVSGTDNQSGYVNPNVWFYIDNTVAAGGTVTLLNTAMKVVSTSVNYRLDTAAGTVVRAIFVEGNGSYQRDDSYGMFSATYNWKAYFDPSTGFIIGYLYVEQDSDPAGDSFTYTDALAVTQTSYALTPGSSTSSSSGSSGGSTPDVALIVLGVVVVAVILVVVLVYLLTRGSRHRTLPRHSATGRMTYVPPPVGPAPPPINLSPSGQPMVQQIVIKETVKVNCRYCGALIDSTVEKCPFCGAART